jgi:putative tricarboxylic transport membrane protein
MRVADVVTAAVLILLGGIVLYDAVRLGFGWGTDGPQSGFFPFWLAVLLIAISAVILIQGARQSTTRPFVTRAQLRPVLSVLLPAVAAVVLMEVLGLYAASALYLAFYMRWVGRHRWITVVGLAVGIPVVTFLVFETWFLVPMPKGPIEHWLGY